MFYRKYFPIVIAQRHSPRSFLPMQGLCRVFPSLDDTVKMDIQLLVHEPHTGG